MSKHKKTRQEKIIADLRRKLAYQNSTQKSKPLEKLQEKKSVAENKLMTPHFQYQTKPPEINIGSQKTTNSNKYPYLKHDLLKTGILTGSFLIAEFLLFFILKNHFINLPMLNY